MFFERPDTGERAVLVHLVLTGSDQPEANEFEELVVSAGAKICGWLTCRRDKPDPRFYLGSGKVQELRQVACDQEAGVVIFNHDLSPSQERNLEAELQCRVLSRTGLILDIFAQRARTHEGKLQVELAQLGHLSTRLIRGWTHLERQKGGIGLRGPGETQLETDRRLLRERIKSITARLAKVRTQRQQGRRSRQRNGTPTVSIVGYTNAGKSTLFNRLSNADVYAEDQLFATLDLTMRKIDVSSIGDVVTADTVGFISHLPHKLVEAFRATLEEAANADLLVHVVDFSRPDWRDTVTEVKTVLREIGAEEIPTLMVYNKIDLVGDCEPRIEYDAGGAARAVFVSASQGSGMDELHEALQSCLIEDEVAGWFALAPEQGRFRAKLYQLRAIKQENHTAEGLCEVLVRISRRDWERTLSSEGIEQSSLLSNSAN